MPEKDIGSPASGVTDNYKLHLGARLNPSPLGELLVVLTTETLLQLLYIFYISCNKDRLIRC